MSEDKCDTCKLKEQRDNLENGLRMAIRFVLQMIDLVDGNDKD